MIRPGANTAEAGYLSKRVFRSRTLATAGLI